MHDAAGVCEAERGRDLAADLGGATRMQRPVTTDHLRQRGAVDVLHDDEVRAVLGPPVEDPDDVRMRQVRGGLRLAAEPLDEAGIGRELGRQLLDGDGAIEGSVTGQVHLGHAAAGEPLVDLVAVSEDSLFLLSHGPASVECRSRQVVSCAVARSSLDRQGLVHDRLRDRPRGGPARRLADAGKVLDDDGDRHMSGFARRSGEGDHPTV